MGWGFRMACPQACSSIVWCTGLYSVRKPTMATEVETQLAEHPLMSPRAELKPEKKSEHRPRSHGDGRPQKELMIPGIVDFQLIQTAPKTPKPQTPGAYHFGRLSHHSFFSRHHPHPQHVTHIREAWKKELKDLTSQVAIFTKENELKSKEKEEPQRQQGAKYSAETGRLIPTSTRAIGRRHSRQSPWIYPSGKDGGVQTIVLQDQELLVPTPADRSHSRHQQPRLGSPHIPPDPELDLPPMTLTWRTQVEEGPEVAEMPEAEEAAKEAAEKEACTLLGEMEPQAGQSAEAASPDPQPAHWDHPTSMLASPDPGSSRVGRPVGFLKSPRQGPRDLGLDPGAPLSDPADRLLERYPVLAPVCSPEGERPGAGTPADSGGSAPSAAPRLYPGGKTSRSAPGSPRAISREATAILQPIPEEDEATAPTQRRQTRVRRESTSSSDAFKPERRRENFKAKGRMLSPSPFACLAQELPPGLRLFSAPPPQQQHRFSYHTEPIKRLPSL
ncbi:protein TBATA isoform X5 [Zalophus californianus]|uniref:Protein TBATA isoform X5 n=1 Tax=Zalophus californianus TaxID=9704 RepID=A0A6J2D7S2_ZALCA|nr:protein TBATA isoform X5 [Zalophus californianus]